MPRTVRTISGAGIIGPQSNVLDNFNRANSISALGSNWTYFTRIAGDQGIINNTAYNPAAQFASYVGMMWNPTTFGPDCEGFITITTVPTMNNGDDGPAIDLRITSPGTNYNSYSFGVNGGTGAGTKAQINKAVNGTETTLVSGLVSIASGDKLWFTAIGNTLTGYKWDHTTGLWSQVLQTTDTTYAGVTGNIGFYIPGNNVDGRFDDFGAGNININRFSIRDLGTSLQFNHNGSYVNIANSAGLNPSAFTLAAWIMPSDFDVNDYQNNFISKENDSSAQGFVFRCGGGKLNFSFGNGSGNPQAEASAKNIFSGVWQHVIATYDGSTITIYINGLSVATQAAGGYVTSTVPFRVGRSSTFSSRDYYGYIDDVVYLNTALSSSQAADLYYGRNYFTANQILWWKFDDGSGTSAIDSSGNGNTGTLTSGSGLPAWSSNVFMKARLVVT